MGKTMIILLALSLLIGCGAAKEAEGMPEPTQNAYRQISMDEAQELMASESGYVILDVRRPDEFAAGHIPGAVNLPNESIGAERPGTLPDLGQQILIYCRSGNRSKQAAEKLAALGYTNIVEFGGILDWPGEIETENDEKEQTMKLFIHETEVPVTWEDNPSVEALRELAAGEGLTVGMSMYGGFEQVGPIGAHLPRDDRQTTTSAGDIVLYSGNQIVVFYGSNSWAYTRLGKIGLDTAELAELLGRGDVQITIKTE